MAATVTAAWADVQDEIGWTAQAGPTLPSRARLDLELWLAKLGLLSPFKRLRIPSGRYKMLDAINLVTSELLTNACQVAPSNDVGFKASITVDENRHGGLWLGAWDSSPEMPVLQAAPVTLADIDALPELNDASDHLDPIGGWGLHLVMDLVPLDCRDVTTTGDGKWVRARLEF